MDSTQCDHDSVAYHHGSVCAEVASTEGGPCWRLKSKTKCRMSRFDLILVQCTQDDKGRTVCDLRQPDDVVLQL